MPKDDDYEVGYGKPPKHTRFTKGQSGNPKGRPKGSKSLYSEIEEELNQKVRINTEKGVRYITKKKALVMQALHNALAGKSRQGLRDALQLAQLVEQNAENQPHISIQDHRDQSVIKNLKKRIRESENDEPDIPEEP